MEKNENVTVLVTVMVPSSHERSGEHQWVVDAVRRYLKIEDCDVSATGMDQVSAIGDFVAHAIMIMGTRPAVSKAQRKLLSYDNNIVRILRCTSATEIFKTITQALWNSADEGKATEVPDRICFSPDGSGYTVWWTDGTTNSWRLPKKLREAK